MIIQMYTIYDKKAKTFQHPFCSPNRATMMRTITDNLQRNPEGLLSKYPEDYDLIGLGTFDVSSAEIVVPDKSFICSLKDLILET